MVAKLFAFIALATVTAASDFSTTYSVAEPHTGDFKNQIETRSGNYVQSQYSLLEFDGTRTGNYAAGAGGFNTVVRKTPAPITPVVSEPISRILPVGPIPAFTKSISYSAPIEPTLYLLPASDLLHLSRTGVGRHLEPNSRTLPVEHNAAPFPCARH